MKIKFCQLPKEEKRIILWDIAELTKNTNDWKERLRMAEIEVECCKFQLDSKNHDLRILKDKYDFE